MTNASDNWVLWEGGSDVVAEFANLDHSMHLMNSTNVKQHIILLSSFIYSLFSINLLA